MSHPWEKGLLRTSTHERWPNPSWVIHTRQEGCYPVIQNCMAALIEGITMIWLTPTIYEECQKAERDWKQRLPSIVARTEKAAEEYREAQERKARWTQCDW